MQTLLSKYKYIFGCRAMINDKFICQKLILKSFIKQTVKPFIVCGLLKVRIYCFSLNSYHLNGKLLAEYAA